MSIFTSIEQDFEAIWDGIKGAFNADVEPVLKSFFQQFASDDGKLILTDGIAAAAGLASGASFASIGAAMFTDLLAKSETIAAQDAGKVLLTVQSALQIGKVAAGTLTASDHAIVATAAPAPAPAPEPAPAPIAA
jgi:hypothetical protein